MSDDALIEWSKSGPQRDQMAALTVFDDGRVRLGTSFGGGEFRLSPEALQALRRFIFDEQQFQTIDEETMKREIKAAAAKRTRESKGTAAEFVAAPQMDAGTTTIRAQVGGTRHEITCFDLVGDAYNYPEVQPLQRLRRIELRLLELAETRPQHSG